MIRIRKWKSGIPELETEKLQEKLRNYATEPNFSTKPLTMAPGKERQNGLRKGKKFAAEEQDPPSGAMQSPTTTPRKGSALPEPRTPGE